MAKCLLAFFLILKLVVALAKAPTALNETCVDDIGFDLQFNIYQESCPEAEAIVFSWVETAISEDPRMAASLLRLHFHDCFVNASHVFMLHVLSLHTLLYECNANVHDEFCRVVMLQCC